MNRLQSAAKTKSAWLYLALVTLTLVVYARVATFDFTNYDDGIFVYENPHVTSGLTLANLAWAFSTSFFDFWHPLTWLSHMFDCQVFGLNPGWHHLTNVALHVISSLLLFAVLRRMTGSVWRSAMVSALFGLHPLHVESVAWVSERKDVLSGLLFMLTLWAWGQAVTPVQHVSNKSLSVRPRKMWYALSLVFFAFGLMSKAMLVTVPFVLLLLDYWPLRRLEPRPDATSVRHAFRLLVEKAPFFALTVLSCVITYLGMSAGHNIHSAEKVPWGLRLANIPVSYVRYLWKTLWPANLAPLYPMPDHWPLWEVCGAVLLLVLATALVLKFARSAPYALVGWLLFLGMLVPVIGLVPNGMQSIADRYMYLPSIGLFLLFVWALTDIGVQCDVRIAPMLATATCALAACAIVTWNQLDYWRDSSALWARCLAVTHDNAVAEYNMGVTLRKLGQTNEALVHLERAVQIKPDFEDAANLGVAFAMSGQFQKATNYFDLSLRLKPDYVKAHEDYGWALIDLHEYPAAILHCRRAAELDPASVRSWSGLAKAYAANQQLVEAAQCYSQVAKLQPDDAEVQFQTATMLDAQGLKAEAASRYRATLRPNPDHIGALNNLAWLLATSRKVRVEDAAEAVRLSQRACELTHFQEPVLVGTLGACYASAGDFENAIQVATKACTLAAAQGNTNLVVRNQELMRSYQARQRYSEN